MTIIRRAVGSTRGLEGYADPRPIEFVIVLQDDTKLDPKTVMNFCKTYMSEKLYETSRAGFDGVIFNYVPFKNETEFKLLCIEHAPPLPDSNQVDKIREAFSQMLEGIKGHANSKYISDMIWNYEQIFNDETMMPRNLLVFTTPEYHEENEGYIKKTESSHVEDSGASELIMYIDKDRRYTSSGFESNTFIDFENERYSLDFSITLNRESNIQAYTEITQNFHDFFFRNIYKMIIEGQQTPVTGYQVLDTFKVKQPPINKSDREGYIYFIEIVGKKRVKIGFSGDVEKRFNALQTSSPFPLRVLKSIKGTPANEANIHELFASDRVKGEWFRKTKPLMKYIRGLNSD